MSGAVRERLDSPPSPEGGPQPAQRVLILRSCRAAEFAAAVRIARARHPKAEIAALTHPGHRDALRAAGVDRIVEMTGRRFGLLRLSPWTLQRLRADSYDEVVIPQMSAYADVHVNLYWVVSALRCRAVLILAGETMKAFDHRSFFRYTLRQTFSGLLATIDVPVFLALLAAALVLRGRQTRPPASGRRRVLHVISSLGVGGAQVQLAEVLDRTPADQYDVELLVLGRSDGDFSRQWLNREDVTISFLDEWPRLTPSVFEIRDRCRAGQYDLVHTWLFMANIVAVAGARLAGVPLVIASVRNLSVWKREQWYRKWWHRTADILGSHAADVVTVNAHALVADHARWALMRQSRIEVIHNGLDPSRFLADRREARGRLVDTAGVPADAVLVGTVGRLAHEKDQSTFLRIVAEVRKTRPAVRGIVVGHGELRSVLEALAAELGLADALVFLGERSDARQLMAGLDLFVLTSLSEGFPNVLLEATLFGVPCVATNLAGNPDVLVLEESLFPAGSVSAGTQRVHAMLANPAATAERQQTIRQRAMTLFTAERSVANWLDLYRRAFGDA
jgi:glycosyltransferase involved in cell wall biosynthesis